MAEAERAVDPASVAFDRRRGGGEMAAAISNTMVRLLSEYTGRGPTRARTFIDDGLVVCLLRDTLTKGERALADRGETLPVLDIRRTFQRAMREDAVRAVEELTGQRVIAFMSDNHVDPDVAVEVFVLDPASEAGERPELDGHGGVDLGTVGYGRADGDGRGPAGRDGHGPAGG